MTAGQVMGRAGDRSTDGEVRVSGVAAGSLKRPGNCMAGEARLLKHTCGTFSPQEREYL